MAKKLPRKSESVARAARHACEKWREYFKLNIDTYHTMHTFVLGQQWTDDEESEMVKTYRKVPLQANKLGTMANTLMGEQQQNTPQLQVVPMENCDEQTSSLRELVVKDITSSEDAKIAYQVMAGQAAIGGFSAFCWDTEYTHRKSFDLDIVPRYFKDATRTYFDIGAESINKTDSQRSGYISRMSRTKFRKLYGKELEEKISKVFSPTPSKDEIALSVQPSEGDDPFSWADTQAITIIHDYELKYSKETLYKMSNGKIFTEDELADAIKKTRERMALNESMSVAPMDGEMEGMEEDLAGTPTQNADDEMMEPEEFEDTDLDTMTIYYEGEPIRIEDSRQTDVPRVIHRKIAGDYILEEDDFPAEQSPMVFVDNNSYYDKNGKQICRSFFGDAKDTQRYINYLRTQSAYIIKITRYDQYMGSKKNVASLDTQRNWRDPNNTQGMITYDESPSGAKPEPLRTPELPQSLMTQYQLAIEDLYTCTGLYPTRMGDQGNEVSGKAIDARTRQGSYSTYVFFNSINRAIAAGGQIVNEMIPRVYDSERVLALMTPDRGMKNITVNRQADEYGELIENDIRKGTFEVRLKPGPSFEGQKQQALESLQMVLQANPEVFQLVADLYAENLPLANNIELRNRLKTIVPPAIIQAGKSGDMPQQGQQGPSPEEKQMMMQEQAMQAEQQLKAKELELKAQELEMKKQQILMDAQAKIQELENERLAAAAEIQEQELRYMAETERTQSDEQIAHADNLVKLLTHRKEKPTRSE
jgi:hypothetical protein